MKQDERINLKRWAEFKEWILSLEEDEPVLSESEIKKKREYLEDHPIEWIRFFFHEYTRYEFMKFHLDAIKRITSNGEWYEVLSWSRELAKSTIVMMSVVYLVMINKKKNIIIASATVDSAEKLLKPYKQFFESNKRLKTFYGDQKTMDTWSSTYIVLKNGAVFSTVGSGSAPRGVKNKSVRPDAILIDDFDTDEDCRNAETLNKKWDWIEKALIPTRSISEPTLIVFCGNIIAKDCCIKRAGAMADHWDIVNIVDKQGNSTWPCKNTMENIKRIQAKTSTKAFEGEYKNNPVSEGKIFRNCCYGKVPALSKFKFLINYGDPSYSNNKKKNSSMKALILMGKYKMNYYIIKAYVDHCTNAEFIAEYFFFNEWVNGRSSLYNFMENNKLQDPFFDQVFRPLLRDECKRRKQELYIRGDEAKKTDKATRIEANLEPLDREGRLIFNEAEKDDPYMKELINQFKLFDIQLSYCADGPDAVEGGKSIVDKKNLEDSPTETIKYDDIENPNDF